VCNSGRVKKAMKVNQVYRMLFRPLILNRREVLVSKVGRTQERLLSKVEMSALVLRLSQRKNLKLLNLAKAAKAMRATQCLCSHMNLKLRRRKRERKMKRHLNI